MRSTCAGSSSSWRFLAATILCAALLAAGAGSPARASAATTLFKPTAAAAGDNLGLSVSGAGDVNGDGYGDVIVGAHLNDAGGLDAGRAYVYFGGPGADAIADLTLTGEFTGDNFGICVAAAGDVNGDGYGDVVVGAYSNDFAGLDAGRAYVYYGGPGADAIADLTLTGAAAGDAFGVSVSGAGDVNRDGFADVIVGAYQNDAAGANAGRAYVFYGGGNNVADITLTGAAANDAFGVSVSGAGDVNRDGFADVIVGAYQNDAGGADAGRAYVYHGAAAPDAVADLTLNGPSPGDNFGLSVSGAGDVNGDGHADVIVGAHLSDAVGTDAGRAYVFFGAIAPDALADMFLGGGSGPGDFFGFSVSRAGDINGDGYGDVIVGAFSNDAGGIDAGRAYVYHGGMTPDPVADLTLTGTAAGDNFGRGVAGAERVNGDAYGDVIVGAYLHDAGGLNAGRAYVFTSRSYEVLSPNRGEQWIIGRQEQVRWLGSDPADLWISLNGGVSYSLLASGVGGGEQNKFDVVCPEPGTTSARIRVSVSGAPVTQANSDESDGAFSIAARHVPPAAAHRLTLAPVGEAFGDQFGIAVSDAGDVNGDGHGDFIVGTPANDAAGLYSGRAYVYYAGPGADDVADLTLTGAAGDDFFGLSVSDAGDVNGDGYGDVIVGAWGNDAGGLGAGRAYVYYGGPAADAIADLTLTGAAAGDAFGYSVSGAGDMNRDGYGDVIVGANFNDTGGSDAGRAYVFYGGTVPNAVADVILTGAAAADLFGISVSGAGDVNGDGYGDVIVGAHQNDAGGQNAGRAYVYYGGRANDAVVDITMTGTLAGARLGVSVSDAGDTNGDGYGDVIVGADFFEAGYLGRAYVYHGGPAAEAVADLTLTGEGTITSYFGRSVSGAGDVNGDGYDDLIVGSETNDAAGADAGRVYAYYGGPGADAVADVMWTGVAAFDRLGASVSGLGDTNGDGHGDVIVGVSGYGAGGTAVGRAHLYDFNRYFAVAPNGGETWNVGAQKTISWLGAEPADVWLSVDGGNTHQLVESRAGGSATNALAIQVPHTPTKFARIKLTPSNLAVDGSDRSDSLFTIQTSVSLLALLAAPLPQGGASISWRTDPGPADLAGYRLEKAQGGAGAGAEWRTVLSTTRETSYTDPSGGPGARYRLFAVNGFGEELWLGEAALRPATPLAAWPLPYRGGDLSISFAAAGGLGGGAGRTEVAIFDLHGRLIRRLAEGNFAQGYHTSAWDGRDGRGQKVASGIYFLRSMSGGEQRTLRLCVLR